MATIVVRGRWRSQASGLARKRGVMASKITRQQPRATFPGLTEGSGYEREAAVPGCLGTGVPDHAEAAQGLPRGEGRPEAARTLPQRERARADLGVLAGGPRAGTRWLAQVPAKTHALQAGQPRRSGDRGRARLRTARRQRAQGKRPR